MTIKLISSNYNKEDYNCLAIHPLQSWQWGEARKEMGIEVLRISNGKEIFQITFHKIPYIPYKIGYIPRSKFPSKEVLKFLYEYGRKNRIIFFKFELNTIHNSKFLNHNSKLLAKSHHPLFPSWTQVLDLTKSEDELLKNMKPKTRYNIRLAQKKGVAVKEMSSDEGFQIFSRLYFETCKRQKYYGHTHEFHKIVWKNLKKDIAHILIAFYNNLPLAAYELFYFNKTIYYPYGGTSNQYRNMMAANLIMWEAIRLGKSLGAKTFDMWGSLPPKYDINNSWAGFTRFKEGYGTEFVEMVGSYDLIINPVLYKIYSLMYSIRNKLLGGS